MRNILALAKEAINGNQQAILEFNDILEENDIKRIKKYKIYYNIFSVENDINSLSKIKIEKIVNSNLNYIVGFIKGMIKLNKALNHEISDNRDFMFCYDINKENLLYKIYLYFLDIEIGIEFSENKIKISNLLWYRRNSNFVMSQNDNELAYLNNWLFSNFKNKNKLEKQVIETGHNIYLFKDFNPIDFLKKKKLK